MKRRIAHFGDTHLGYRAIRDRQTPAGENQRQADTRRAFTETIGDILREHRQTPIDLVVHAGDIFNHPRPQPADLVAAMRAMAAFRDANIPQVWVAGNHDLSRLRTTEDTFTILRAAFTGQSGIYIWSEPTWHSVTINEVQVDGYPHNATEATDPAPADPAGRLRIAVAHGEIDSVGELRQGDRAMMLPRGYDYIALGHIHETNATATGAGPVFESGSTERFGWRDAGHAPGWYLVSATGDGRPIVERREIDTRQMIDLGTITLLAGDTLPQTLREVEQRIEAIATERGDELRAGAMWRVHLDGIGSDQAGRWRQAITGSLTRLWHIQVDTTAPGQTWRAPLQRGAQTAGLNIGALFEEFLTSRIEDLGAEFVERFRTAGLEALAEAARAEAERVTE